jgi:hypothetical protein
MEFNDTFTYHNTSINSYDNLSQAWVGAQITKLELMALTLVLQLVIEKGVQKYTNYE